MIVFETAATAIVRAGEAEIAGRRIAGRMVPYTGEAGAMAFRFDPIERRFVFRKPVAVVAVGPSDPDVWRDAVAKLPAGPVLVGPGSQAEEVRGAYRAAAEGALAAGRPVYLLDPAPAGLPEPARGAIVLCCWRPGPPPAFPSLATARGASLSCGILFPLIPGWTAEPGTLDALLAEAAAGGAVSATALLPSASGEAKRGIVEARGSVEPEAVDRFFELIHHGDWVARTSEHLARARAACGRRGLALLPPRPLGRSEPPGNAAAAGRLEERAELQESDEHRAALLHAAVRWIDESGRDLTAVAREGNFRRVFPFGAELAGEAEAVLREAR